MACKKNPFYSDLTPPREFLGRSAPTLLICARALCESFDPAWHAASSSAAQKMGAYKYLEELWRKKQSDGGCFGRRSGAGCARGVGRVDACVGLVVFSTRPFASFPLQFCDSSSASARGSTASRTRSRASITRRAPTRRGAWATRRSRASSSTAWLSAAVPASAPSLAASSTASPSTRACT